MKRFVVPTFVFLTALAAGWATAPRPAECRKCMVKRCFHDSACGRTCACVFEGGKSRDAGVCMQVGDDVVGEG